MVFDVLVVASIVAAIWCWVDRRTPQARHARGNGSPLLAYEDLPPVGAFDPMPDEPDLDDYIRVGMEHLTTYVSGRDQTA